MRLALENLKNRVQGLTIFSSMRMLQLLLTDRLVDCWTEAWSRAVPSESTLSRQACKGCVTSAAANQCECWQFNIEHVSRPRDGQDQNSLRPVLARHSFTRDCSPIRKGDSFWQRMNYIVIVRDRSVYSLDRARVATWRKTGTHIPTSSPFVLGRMTADVLCYTELLYISSTLCLAMFALYAKLESTRAVQSVDTITRQLRDVAV